ncbi:hypothetical protein EZH22_27705 [Xanthobacter dioxanivorans]|uniref:Hydroxyquinol 1,2-dioxygenase n=1 Tax=Xanthobacter dioxanivorans TaxID=2528964 RepID=A0A974SHU3_9HYPH|nr:hypothetical protein [Xanthobacter dioxanivorans]QRG06656.1 hypothetical protein EZH22_27705 [Xanthobacter dioxanivorans]
MSIKSTILAIGLASTVLSAAGAAFADPMIGPENREQYAVSAQESLVPTSSAAAAREAARLGRPSAFGTPGPYYTNEGPFSSADPHWGAARDADDN